jgi:dihydroorotase
MPNTKPVTDNAALVAYIKNTGSAQGMARIYPIGAITRESQGQELAEMGDMKKAGAKAYSDDGQPVADAALMRRAMQYACMLDMPIISHCENKELSSGGAMHEGYMSTLLGLKGIPASSEEVMVARDLLLAEETGCRVHIAHVSTAGSVEIIRRAKQGGVLITAETCPQYFTLTEKEVLAQGAMARVNPPLRTEVDVEAVLTGLLDGTIDAIATDHAPHSAEEKALPLSQAPSGMVGLETSLGLALTALFQTGKLPLLKLIGLMSTGPADILGIPKGSLARC